MTAAHNRDPRPERGEDGRVFATGRAAAGDRQRRPAVQVDPSRPLVRLIGQVMSIVWAVLVAASAPLASIAWMALLRSASVNTGKFGLDRRHRPLSFPLPRGLSVTSREIRGPTREGMDGKGRCV